MDNHVTVSVTPNFAGAMGTLSGFGELGMPCFDAVLVPEASQSLEVDEFFLVEHYVTILFITGCARFGLAHR